MQTELNLNSIETFNKAVGVLECFVQLLNYNLLIVDLNELASLLSLLLTYSVVDTDHRHCGRVLESKTVNR